jgi:hypothetical protein
MNKSAGDLLQSEGIMLYNTTTSLPNKVTPGPRFFPDQQAPSPEVSDNVNIANRVSVKNNK